jgi:hypothetical protein
MWRHHLKDLARALLLTFAVVVASSFAAVLICGLF